MPNPVIYSDSLYSSGIYELESAIDFIRDYARLCAEVPVGFVDDVCYALKGRADKLREHESASEVPGGDHE